MKNIFANVKDLVIIVLLGILLFKQFGKSESNKPIIITHSDTTYVSHVGQMDSKPQVINVLPPKQQQIPVQYLPDTNYAKLKTQFESLRDEFLTKKTYSDTLKVDSIGSVSVTDTVYKNELTSRKWAFNIKERIINNTTTIYEPYKPRNQVFVGISVGGTTEGIVNQGDINIFLKNKKDNLVGVSAGYNFQTNSPQYKITVGKKLSIGKPRIL